MTEPASPALALDGLEAVVFDTDGVLTDTASVHAAAWKRLFDIAVAYNVWQYDQVTGDLAFLEEYGAEMLLEIARFWTTIASYDHASDRYVLWLNPSLPEELDGLDFDVRYRGNWGISLHLTPDRLRVRVPASCAAPVRIGVRGEVVELDPSTTREFPC